MVRLSDQYKVVTKSDFPMARMPSLFCASTSSSLKWETYSTYIIRMWQSTELCLILSEMSPLPWLVLLLWQVLSILLPEVSGCLFQEGLPLWKHSKCPLTDGWIKKMWYVYNGILLRHKKEWNNAICSNMDGPRDCHTEWSKSDRERQMSYDITYMWNLK